MLGSGMPQLWTLINTAKDKEENILLHLAYKSGECILASHDGLILHMNIRSPSPGADNYHTFLSCFDRLIYFLFPRVDREFRFLQESWWTITSMDLIFTWCHHSTRRLRWFPHNIRAIMAKIKLLEKTRWHVIVLNAVNKNLSRFKLSSWPRERKLNLKLSIFHLKETFCFS